MSQDTTTNKERKSRVEDLIKVGAIGDLFYGPTLGKDEIRVRKEPICMAKSNETTTRWALGSGV